MLLNQTVLILFALLAVNYAAAEKLSYRLREDSQWRLFVENAKSEAEQYSVDLLDLNKKQPMRMVQTFQPSLMKGILERNLSTKGVPDGLYYMDLKRNGDSVNKTKPIPLVWDDAFLTQTVQVDRITSKLSWKPLVPCLARIIAVLPSGMLMDVVTEWTFYGVHEQIVDYNFIGDDGRTLRTQANLSIFAQYIPLPSTFFVQGQPKLSDYSAVSTFQDLKLPRTPLHFKLSTNAKLMNGDPETYLGSDTTSITVELDPQTAQQLSGRRFEVLIYLDGEFIHEEAQGASPYTYQLPELTTTDKPQAISVNVLDYLGNWGTQTLQFKFLL